jgi:hypothetical protein
VNYWKTDPKTEQSYLLKQIDDIRFTDCDVVVISHSVVEYGSGLPEGLFAKSRTWATIYLDFSDGLITPAFDEPFRSFDVILKTHYNIKYDYPENFAPWQFGLSERILQAVSPVPFQARNLTILTNFRHLHSLRNLIKEKFLPLLSEILKEDPTMESLDEIPTDEWDRLHWHQTGRRHYPAYYRRLSNSAACACFGGSVQKRMFRYNRVYQYDSWRFWESLAAGCSSFHLDLEKYGARFPVMPVNFEHYIGVDLENMKSAANRIREEKGLLARVSEKGRAWALTHYSPKAIAARFLDLVQMKL